MEKLILYINKNNLTLTMAEDNNNIESIQEIVKKLKAMVINSDSDCPTNSYEYAKRLGLKIDKSPSNITNRAVSGIVKQVTGNKIQISLRQLLKIVNPRFSKIL